MNIKRWFEYRVAPGVDDTLPFVYEWHVEGKGSGFGETANARGRRRGLPFRIYEYDWVIANHLQGKPLRPGDPNRKYRTLHDNLAHACRAGREVTVTIIENIADKATREKRDDELVAERGVLNRPMVWVS
jgi:hypothetical protein